MLQSILEFDKELLIWSRNLVDTGSTLFIQFLGESIVLYVALFLIGIWLTGVIKKDDTWKVRSLQIVSTILLTFLIYTIINFGIPPWRPNPQEITGSIGALIPHPLDNSFPSGHALFTAAFLIGCIRFYRNRWILIFGIIFGILTAFARVTGGVHYPGDILGGWIFGGLGAYFMSRYAETAFFRKWIFAPLIRIAQFFHL